jgi:hypothetical protein
MKSCFLSLIFSLLAISSVYSQVHQERDPKKNEDLYLIPEIRIGYGFLDTDNQMAEKASSTWQYNTYHNYVPLSYSAFLNFGYHITPRIGAGIGTGIMQYSGPKSTSLPTYIDLRGFMYDEKETPFVFAKIGTCLQWWKTFTPGSWATLGVGYKFFLGKQCYTAALGYEFKHISSWEALNPDGVKTYALNRHSITVTFGMYLY